MTSREQFEAWFRKEHEELENSNELSAKVMKMIACHAWQASRNVEIELPDKVFVEDEFDKGHNFGIEYCAEAIAEAGFKVKGE
ncbi:TPA: hypothetical protein PIP43_000510 [Klebsiella pneumoniae]|uniref:hypothetical protein n=1 Tax=Klebsiella pneumoniae TaxID=573 RepID=UPI003310C617|nr:hypothetical protein [Klebsiella pneumoniae]HDH0589742.1 hypothetical protein [Klebsiella pneumoniae]HDH0615985.1 hypothetical protein [Klebsiella pneumoniae]HDH0625837.1 hypothetical protein [Klebsiella pneumoniae]HDH0686526.1 hypothetical protein [Klebsiella pneumoniae]